MNGRSRTLLCVSVVLHFSVHGQQRTPIILNYADSLVSRTIDGEPVRIASGRVEFLHGNVTVRCDEATQFLKSNKAVLVGSVNVTRDRLHVSADRGVYYGNEKVMESEGNVRLKDGAVILHADFGKYYPDEHRANFWQNVKVIDTTSIIQADSLTYYEEGARSVAMGDVRLIDSVNRMVVFGRKLEHEGSSGYTRVTELPRLLQVDTTSTGGVDTLFVTSRVMESVFDTTHRYVATDSVTLVRGQLSSRSERMTYEPEQERLYLRGSPILWYARTQVSGDSIDVHLHHRRANRVLVMGRAFAISEGDVRYPRRLDQLTGETMTMTFFEEKVQRIKVDTTATSLYYLYDEGKPNGLNKSSGDSIILSFSDGELSDITVIGGVEGEYYPENMVADRESEYDLAGFQWIENKPRKNR